MRYLVSGAALLTLGRAGRVSAKDPVTYTYDALGRLTSASYPGGVTINYTYDAAGNRTQVDTGTAPPPALAASLSASTWNWVWSGAKDPPVIVTVTGGTPPYTYLWQRVSGNSSTFATSPTANTTDWIFTGGGFGNPIKNSVWRCQVTDAASTTIYTANVSVTIDVR